MVTPPKYGLTTYTALPFAASSMPEGKFTGIDATSCPSMDEITSTSFSISTLTNTSFRIESYTIPVADLSVLKKELRVGVVFAEKGIVTVKGTMAIAVLLLLSEAVIVIGKFCNGCANDVAISEKESGFVGVRKPWGLPTVICELLGGPEAFTDNCGEVPALAVADI